jgi:NADH:ubiquinone oxidoreductase subunit E
MVKIEICVGSSCHIKGSQQVIRAFQEQIEKFSLTDKVEIQLIGSFCQGKCTRGVNIKVNGQPVDNVSPEQIPAIFERWVLGGITHVSHIDTES